MWRSLSLKDCFAAEQSKEMIFSSFNSVPTKIEGREFESSSYSGVALASSNWDLKSMSTISLTAASFDAVSFFIIISMNSYSSVNSKTINQQMKKKNKSISTPTKVDSDYLQTH